MKRAILLDVDGVLAPFDRPDNDPEFSHWAEPWQQVNEYYDMWMNPAMGKAIANLAAEFEAELFWVTTWYSEPKDLGIFGKVLGLEPIHLPVEAWDGGSKFRAARWVSDRHDQTVWFDDDHWRFNEQGMKLQIRPNSELGLRQYHIEKARKFFNATSRL
jgi:hypothetical protein